LQGSHIHTQFTNPPTEESYRIPAGKKNPVEFGETPQRSVERSRIFDRGKTHCRQQQNFGAQGF
jgi:hypothetical protein